MKRKGFTIIEVVLVLAIAGLIFLMVFVALPSLQRSQRNTQRRNDMARLATAIKDYQTNNNGRIPGLDNADYFANNYLSNDFMDPNGEEYSIHFFELKSGEEWSVEVFDIFRESFPDDYVNPIGLISNAYCNDGVAKYVQGSNNFVILYKLEGSGSICLDNS